MRTLRLFRHGKPDWGIGVADREWPLKGKGKRAARHMGVGWPRLGICPISRSVYRRCALCRLVPPGL